MKKIVLLVLVMGCVQGLFAQSTSNEKTLFEKVSKIEKKVDWFHLYLNMQGTFNANFNYEGVNGLQQAAFKMNQLRIEAKGNVTPWLSYRWRQRLNRGSGNGSTNIDNMPTSIDIAGIGVKLNDQFSFFAGKQCTVYGGIEFDLNPIEIYEYCDMIEYMSNFMTGLNIAFQANENHQIQFQILDSRNGSVEETYGDINEVGIGNGRAPLVYTLNWNGNFFDGAFKTRWSASIMSEAEKKQMYYYALGNELTLGDFNMYFDFMYSDEDLDRKGIMTDILGGRNNLDNHVAFNAKYMSMVAKFNYRVAPKWNVFIKGMYETASIFKATDGIEKGKYRTSYGYLAGVEYYPMESNLHFFANFTGRSYNFTHRAAGYNNYDTQRVSVGFIYQLPMF
ncbi:porin [uncultured Sanguibacteroides sp.]|uniref:porin n=1 Tax=uncultured Sanguibacteroides sp. TaxID=1635151 RepID=UPI0025E4D720|nr:porin [uncultured Sanguibacteroides sp.]